MSRTREQVDAFLHGLAVGLLFGVGMSLLVVLVAGGWSG